MKIKFLNKSNIIIFILAIIVLLMAGVGISINSQLKTVAHGRTAYKFVDGVEDTFFPFDEAEAKIIDESEPYKEGETWAIYMYLNASNLELGGYSQLSEYVKYVAQYETKKRLTEEQAASTLRIQDFIATENANSIPMPLSFYEADYLNEDADAVPEDKKEKSKVSMGSDILKVFKECELPENFTYVVQPGGAKAWKNTEINPNRLRRYVKQGKELKEVYDAPVKNMGEAETLEEFLTYCKENYPADHTMVILTDHGGAYRGYGWDYIYHDDCLTLKEITEAFDKAYGINEENPPVDLLYFNACLMSNTDVINGMRGITKYMIAGEEVGLSISDYYGIWTEKLCEKPNMNASQIGKALIDSYAKDLTQVSTIFGEPLTSGLSLLDMSKAPLVYDAYALFARNVLENIADNPNILMSFSKAVNSSISFAVDYYKTYNLTDLGFWVEGLSNLYPEESKAMISLIDDAVIYKRADSYLKDAHGISVFFPNYIEDIYSLSNALNYTENISYSEDISALYYYKLAGCLNEKYQKYLKDNNIKEPPVLNYAAFGKLRNTPVTPVEKTGNVKGTIPEEAASVLMDAKYELCKVDESNKTVTCYGQDKFTFREKQNEFYTDFEGDWLSLGGTRLAMNIINSTSTSIVYSCPVKYKGFDYNLIVIRHRNPETEEITTTIEGLRSATDEAATIDRNVIRLTPGMYITPVYVQSGINGGKTSEVTGSKILYSVNTKIDDTKLEKGKYRMRVVFEDIRGDDVYSEPLFFEIK